MQCKNNAFHGYSQTVRYIVFKTMYKIKALGNFEAADKSSECQFVFLLLEKIGEQLRVPAVEKRPKCRIIIYPS